LNIRASKEVNMQSLTVVMLDHAALNRDGVIKNTGFGADGVELAGLYTTG
jgi:hypothetical protein